MSDQTPGDGIYFFDPPPPEFSTPAPMRWIGMDEALERFPRNPPERDTTVRAANPEDAGVAGAVNAILNRRLNPVDFQGQVVAIDHAAGDSVTRSLLLGRRAFDLGAIRQMHRDAWREVYDDTLANAFGVTTISASQEEAPALTLEMMDRMREQLFPERKARRLERENGELLAHVAELEAKLKEATAGHSGDDSPALGANRAQT